MSAQTPPETAVLVVDDSLTARAFTCEVLQEGGYRVIAANDGPSALEVSASAERLDLILSDVLMPGMKGPELVRRVKAARPDIKVILISGYTGEEEVEDVLRETGGRFIKKPVSPDALLRIVAEVLGGA